MDLCQRPPLRDCFRESQPPLCFRLLARARQSKDPDAQDRTEGNEAKVGAGAVSTIMGPILAPLQRLLSTSPAADLGNTFQVRLPSTTDGTKSTEQVMIAMLSRKLGTPVQQGEPIKKWTTRLSETNTMVLSLHQDYMVLRNMTGGGIRCFPFSFFIPCFRPMCTPSKCKCPALFAASKSDPTRSHTVCPCLYAKDEYVVSLADIDFIEMQV